MIAASAALAATAGVAAACAALGVPRSTVYRRRKARKLRVRARPARALSDSERAAVLEVLDSERFQDASPAQVQASLLDEGVYLASTSTMYRVLRSRAAIRERRPQARHPVYETPVLEATGANQVWTWDITKIGGPERRTWYHLYVIIDIYSRYVVGWTLLSSESGEQARRFIADAIEQHAGADGKLTLHADRGTSMRSKTVAEMLDDLGVERSHSRPRTSNDNPYSEAQFKTLKYSANFPGRFASITEGREFLELFFSWYNQEHHHSGLAMMTPADVHHGRADEVAQRRQVIMDKAFAAHPERFVGGRPAVHRPAAVVGINRPVRDVPVGELSATSVPQ